ncbi:MAG: DNA adenine methylase [Ruminococcus sp.]|jgi:DNA adenine methylase|nr:DNA adenine methylase [Ruminococcus sp.]
MKTQAKPFVKWAGGKSQILSEIRTKYPRGLGETITKYAEPFVGGGAVLFDVLNSFSLEAVYISDVNRELIETYKTISDNPDELISVLSGLQAVFWNGNSDFRKTYYYEKRERFNQLKMAEASGTEVAALFIFLNRTCFNGLYRVNSKGGYNVPMGSYKKPTICDIDNLNAVSEKLKNVEIVCGDYKKSREFIDNKTFAYFDPPYRPLTATANFTSYASDGFGDKEQIELAKFIAEMSDGGAAVVASNSDPKNTNASDDFFDNLYSSCIITRIGANRMINSSAGGRGKINELLIANI